MGKYLNQLEVEILNIAQENAIIYIIIHQKKLEKKISDANKGNKYAAGNNYWKDKHHSQKTIEKIRKAHKGKKLTEEHKNKISISLTGRKPSEATIQKIRISNIGKSHKFSIPFFISKEKELITKKQNGSFNGIGQINYNGINTKCSKFEQLIYEKLLLKYSHVEFQYKSDLYPFLCDFYIPELDLYIECQGTWVHGKKPFEPNNKSDLKILKNGIYRLKLLYIINKQFILGQFVIL